MNQFKSFLNRNKKIFAMTCMAILFAMAFIITSCFLLPSKREKVSADTATYWTDYAATSFAGGDGTINNPYKISNARELAYLAVLANSGGTSKYKCYELTKPIDLTGHNWVPIGSGTGKAFYGQLNCNNNPIVGMTIDGAYEYAGLFGLVDNLVVTNAVISNANVNVTGGTGSAGILAGTINYGAGNLQVVDSQFTGKITSNAYPAVMDGVGGVIGTIRSCYSAGSKFENVYLGASINVPNRPSYACTGQIAGSCEVSFLSSNIINVVTSTTMSGKNWTATNNSYKGTFGGTSSSPWFYYATLNSGIPQIKSQYHIGNSFSYTGKQIEDQLKTKGFSSAADSALITVNKKYVVTSTYSTTNNSSRTGFSAGVQTRTGAPNAVYGEKVKVVSSAITGYELDNWSITSGTELNSSEFTMGNSDCTLNVVFRPLTYTVTLNPNGGTVSASTKTVEYDAVPSVFPIATKSNYTMNGWWTAATGGTKVIDENGNTLANVSDYTDENGAWIRTTATTLYAQWRLNEAYLLKEWQDKIAAGLNSTVANVNPRIKTIEFTSIKPSSGTAISVGGINASSSTAHGGTNETCYDVTAYVTGDATNGYNIKFYSPHTIYFPADSLYLFSNSNSSFRLTGLKTIIFNNINTSKVTIMSDMFGYCQALTTLDLSSFNTSKVTRMSFMFENCSGLTTLDLSNFDTSKVTSMLYMFSYCSSLTSLDLSNFNTSKVTNMSRMFIQCSKLTSLDLSSFNTSNVTDMSNMFYNCSGLTTLDLSSFNTSNVTNMSGMFYNCKALTTLDLSNFNTSNVTGMSGMFGACSRLTTLNVSGFNTSNVTDMSDMFGACSRLTTLNVSGFDTSNVKDMSNMFYNCSGLTALDLSSFNTSNVTSMNAMFYHCSSLTKLDLSNFDMTKVTNLGNMLSGMLALRVLQTPKNVKVAITLPSTMYDKNMTAYSSIAAGTTGTMDLRIRYTITLNSNGGTCSESTRYVRYQKEYGEVSILPTPTREGYTFRGWYDSSTGGTRFLDDDTHNITSDMTFYAVWREQVSYLTSDWKTIVANSLGVSSSEFLSSVKAIKFTTTKPAEGTFIRVGAKSVGTNTSGSQTLHGGYSNVGCYDLLAYVYGNKSSGYNIYFWAPYKVKAPVYSASLFSGFSNLISLEISNLDTSSVENMTGMFSGCSLLKEIDVSGFNTSKVTEMASMFASTGIVTLDFSNFDLSNVKTYNRMFANCTNLTSLFEAPLVGIITVVYNPIENLDSMFSGCTNLKSLTLSFLSFSNSSINSHGQTMLSGCSSLQLIETPRMWDITIKLPTTMYKVGNNTTGYTSISPRTSSSDTCVYLAEAWTQPLIIYHPNGGDSSAFYRIAGTNTAYGELPTATRDGYSFNGWWTSKTGGTQVSASTTLARRNGYNNLYAHWSKKNLTLILDPNGGTISNPGDWVADGSNYTKVYGVGSVLGYLPTPVRDDGAEFIGWYDALSGGNKVNVSAALTSGGVIYAHWKGMVNVTFDAGDGSTTRRSKTYMVYDDVDMTESSVIEFSENLPMAYKMGGKFIGWAMDPAGNDFYANYNETQGFTTNPEYLMQQTSDFSLYAIFEDVDFIVYKGTSFKASIYKFTTSEGGNDAAIETGYRPGIYLATADLTGELTLPGGSLSSGQYADDVIVELSNQTVYYVGMSFAIRVGGRTVGTGVITELLDAELVGTVKGSMPIEDVFTITGRGTVGTGRVNYGTIDKNDTAVIVGLNANLSTIITGIEKSRKSVDQVIVGDSAGLQLRGIQRSDLQRGMWVIVLKP